MLDKNSIRVRSVGRGAQLEVKYGNRWYTIPLNGNRKVVQPEKRIRPQELRLENKIKSKINTITGGLNADNARVIDLTTVVTLCKTATNKEYFSLGLGAPGQMKVLVHLERLNSVNMKVAFKIANGDAIQQFVSDSAPKTLLLFCDGSYWHPIGEFATHGTSGDSNDLGEWTVTA